MPSYQRRPGADPDTVPPTVAALFDEARWEGQLLSGHYPTLLDAFEVWARLEFATGHLEDARTLWRCLLEKDPRYAYAHHGLGLVAAQQGRFDQAADHQLRTIELMPTFTMAVHEAAAALTRIGHVDQAISVLDEYRSRSGEDPTTLVKLGQTHLAARNYEQARASFAAVVEQHPDIAQAQYGLAVALARLGKTEQAHKARHRCSQLRQHQRRSEIAFRRCRDDFAESATKIAQLYEFAAAVYRSQRNWPQMERLLARAQQLREAVGDSGDDPATTPQSPASDEAVRGKKS